MRFEIDRQELMALVTKSVRTAYDNPLFLADSSVKKISEQVVTDMFGSEYVA